MDVKLFSVDQNTGAETYIDTCDLHDCFDISEETDDDFVMGEYRAVHSILQRNGRAWIGGGAAPLFLALRA